MIQQSHPWVHNPEKKKALAQKHACTPATLSIIVKTQKQPKCTSTDEWTKSWVCFSESILTQP